MFKGRRLILVAFLLILLIFWQLGFFYRFNYLTAQMDKYRDTARIVVLDTRQSDAVDPIAYIGLNEEYGFHEHFEDNVTSEELRGINMYNSEIEKFLNKRNGKNWKKNYQSKLKSLMLDNKF